MKAVLTFMIGLAALAAIPTGAAAAIMTLAVTATVSSKFDILDDGRLASFSIGDTVTGAFTVDTAALPFISNGGTQADYIGAVLAGSFDGAFNITPSNPSSGFVEVIDNRPGVGDFYGVQAAQGLPNGHQAVFITGPASTNLGAVTGLAIADLPDLSLYGPMPLTLLYDYSVDLFSGSITADLTSIRLVQAVAEPASLGLHVLALAGLAFAGLGQTARRHPTD
jgi:hypothetical protein